MTPERINELADASVRLGVGKYYASCWWFESHGFNAEQFITDWRVVGALMEKVQAVFIEALSGTEDRVDVWAVRADRAYGQRTRKWVESESMRLAIAEACLKALGEI